MTLWTKNELLAALSDAILKHNLKDDLAINEVVIDSRKTPKSGLFLAIKGEKNDAHNFLSQAFENGCTAAIIQDPNKIPQDKQFILVKDSFAALYKLAEFSRARSKARIIAITGSVGKTGTKEMLKMVFSTQGKTFATPGNLNNHFGVPLCLSNFTADYEYGIFEIGMNHLNEIEPLSKLARPDLAIITNVGPVHIEFFKNEEEIALAKSEIFAGLSKDGIALINHDSPHYIFLKKRAEQYHLKTFGTISGSDYQIIEYKALNANSSQIKTNLINYEIASSNPAVIFNSSIALACLDLLGNDLQNGLSALKNIETPAGRGKITEIKIADKNITLIDDSYNASLLSMKAGLDHAVSLKKSLNKKRVVAALGDMKELGEKSVELHNEVVDYLALHHIDFAVLVGENMIKAAKILPQNSYKTFLDSSLAASEIVNFLQDGDILYIKGSRGMKMEKVIEGL